MRLHGALSIPNADPEGNSLNSVRGMQVVDGPDSSQLEWHQDGLKTKSDDYCVNCGLNSGGRSLCGSASYGNDLNCEERTMEVGLKVTDQPQESSFADLVSGDNVLAIPLFQRPYRWAEKNLDWLLADIEDIRDGSTRSCFLGVIVCVNRGQSPGRPNPWEIVDGQQRLTSLYLLLLAVTEVAARKGAMNRAAGIVGTYLLVRRLADNPTNTKLQPSFADRSQFKRIWEAITSIEGFNTHPEIAANPPRPPAPSGELDGHMLKQYLRMKKKIAKFWDENGEAAVEELVVVASSKLSVVSISLRDPLVAPKIFERLNNRAQLVTVADLVRNEVFASTASDSSNAEFVFANQWEPFSAQFAGIENGLEKFLFPYGLIINRLVTKADLFQSIRAHWHRFGSPQEVIRDMSCFVPCFLAMENGTVDRSIPAELGQGLLRLHRLGKPSAIYSFVMKVVSAVAEQKLAASTAREIIDVIESFLFRRAICGIEPTGLHAAFKGLWFELTEAGGETNVNAPAVQRALSAKPTVAWPDNATFESKVRTGDLYHRKVVRYALAEFEASRDGESPEDQFEVEHICPQTATEEWQVTFGDQYESILHTWANLLPLTGRMNVDAGQEPYAVKRSEYENSIFASTREVASCVTEWDPQAWATRADQIAAWALLRWPFERVSTSGRD